MFFLLNGIQFALIVLVSLFSYTFSSQLQQIYQIYMSQLIQIFHRHVSHYVFHYTDGHQTALAEHQGLLLDLSEKQPDVNIFILQNFTQYNEYIENELLTWKMLFNLETGYSAIVDIIFGD